MRDYGKIRTQFWSDEKVLRLSDRAKLLFVYFQTGPHTNGIGCFRAPDGYISEDLGWVSRTVGDATATIDMPDRTVSDDVSVPTSGLAITFANAFRSTPKLGSTLQNGQSGDWAEITAGPTASGFSILCMNAAGTPVARTIHYDAKGFGRVI